VVLRYFGVLQIKLLNIKIFLKKLNDCKMTPKNLEMYIYLNAVPNVI